MSGATGMNLQKETYSNYQEYIKRKQSVKFYNLGLAAQFNNPSAIPPFTEAGKYYNMALLINPFDVDAKLALQNAGLNTPDLCATALIEAKQCLKKMGICYRSR